MKKLLRDGLTADPVTCFAGKLSIASMTLASVWLSSGVADAQGHMPYESQPVVPGEVPSLIAHGLIPHAANVPAPVNQIQVMDHVNQQFAAAVVIPTYQQLSDRTEQLAQAAQAFEASPTETTLADVRAAWVDAAAAWSAGSAFAFGPVHSLGYSTALEFPTDEVALTQLLTDATLLDSATEVTSLLPSLRGFEAMNYLLFGSDQPKSLDEFSAQEQMYISKLAIAAHQTSNELLEVWQTGWNGYAPYSTVLATAGQAGNAMYLSPEAGLEEIIRGIVNNLDVVVNEVMPELLEEPEALASVDLQLLHANIHGTHLAYVGAAGPSTKSDATAAPGLVQWVAIAEPEVSAQIQDSLETALVHLESGQSSDTGMDADALAQVNDALTMAYELMDGSVLSLVQP